MEVSDHAFESIGLFAQYGSNGSNDFSFEPFRYRCLKYWLEGDKKGETEIFVDRLPARPDNINLAPDGSFWIALVEVTSQFFSYPD